jgi:hypothetical protein
MARALQTSPKCSIMSGGPFGSEALKRITSYLPTIRPELRHRGSAALEVGRVGFTSSGQAYAQEKIFEAAHPSGIIRVPMRPNLCYNPDCLLGPDDARSPLPRISARLENFREGGSVVFVGSLLDGIQVLLSTASDFASRSSTSVPIDQSEPGVGRLDASKAMWCLGEAIVC